MWQQAQKIWTAITAIRNVISRDTRMIRKTGQLNASNPLPPHHPPSQMRTFSESQGMARGAGTDLCLGRKKTTTTAPRHDEFHPRLLEVSRKEVLSASHVGLPLLRVPVLCSSKKQGLAEDEMWMFADRSPRVEEQLVGRCEFF